MQSTYIFVTTLQQAKEGYKSTVIDRLCIAHMLQGCSTLVTYILNTTLF